MTNGEVGHDEIPGQAGNDEEEMPDQVGHDEWSGPGVTNKGHDVSMEKKGYIYFMTNASNKVLYVGVTNSLKRRISEHAEGEGAAFTRRYNCDKLVYYEVFPEIEQAIAREKQIKHYKRAWKDELVSAMNPGWRDLARDVVLDPDMV